MRIYRIVYTRTIEQSIDIPADKVKDIYEDAALVTVASTEKGLLCCIPTKRVVGIYQMDTPDEPVAQADVEEELDRQRAAEAEAELPST